MQNYQSIGELLARAREERQLSVSEVAGALHIRPRYITALEEGDIAQIPGLPYAKGYLTRYAAFLALDRVEILRRFDMVEASTNTPHFFMPHHFSHEKHIDFATALKCLGLALLLFCIWALWMRPEHGTQSLVDTVPEKVMEPEPVEAPPALKEMSPCLQAQTALYPPCFWPLPEAEPSVMKSIKP